MLYLRTLRHGRGQLRRELRRVSKLHGIPRERALARFNVRYMLYIVHVSCQCGCSCIRRTTVCLTVVDAELIFGEDVPEEDEEYGADGDVSGSETRHGGRLGSVAQWRERGPWGTWTGWQHRTKDAQGRVGLMVGVPRRYHGGCAALCSWPPRYAWSGSQMARVHFHLLRDTQIPRCTPSLC